MSSDSKQEQAMTTEQMWHAIRAVYPQALIANRNLEYHVVYSNWTLKKGGHDEIGRGTSKEEAIAGAFSRLPQPATEQLTGMALDR